MTDLFPGDAPAVSLDRQIECAKRELKMRERVYPRRILQGAMTEALARVETESMRAIVATLEELKASRGRSW
jgi:hypothetical protein